MNKKHRALIPLAIVGIAFLVVAGMVGLGMSFGDLAARETAASQSDSAHISIAVEPRKQEFFPGPSADFSVVVTNSGNVNLAGVATTSSSLAGCARGNLGTLLPGQTTSYACSSANPSLSFLEQFTATAAAGPNRVGNTTDAFVLIKNSDLTVIKRPTRQVVRRGETARFTVIVFNTRLSPVVDVRVINPDIPDCSLDPQPPLNLGTGENNSFDYPCTLKDVQAPVTGVARFEATDPADSRLYSAYDVAWVELIDMQAQLSSQPPSVPEPGGPVSFTVRLANSGSVPVNVDSLTTNQFGDLLNAENLAVPAATNGCLAAPDDPIPPGGGVLVCQFAAAVNGPPSQVAVNLAASASEAGGKSVTANATTSVQITNLVPALAVNLTSDPSLVIVPGGQVELTVRLTNGSEEDNLTIDELEETLLGNLDGVGDCEVPITGLGPADTYTCAFTTVITGQIGDNRVFTVNAAGFDDDPTPNAVLASGTITVPIVESPEKLFLPQVIDTVVEPNDACVRSFPLSLNHPYFFRPPAPFPNDIDYFEFFIEARQSVSVSVSDFAPLVGQVVVWRGPCGQPVIVGQNGNPNPMLERTVELGSQPPGRYFIQVVNSGQPVPNSLYQIIVRTN